MVMWLWSADTLFWQLSDDHNIDVYHQVNHRLQVPILSRMFVILYWFPCGVVGRADVRSRNYQNCSEGLDYLSSPPFFLRDSRASETQARVKITPPEKRRHAAGREKNEHK